MPSMPAVEISAPKAGAVKTKAPKPKKDNTIPKDYDFSMSAEEKAAAKKAAKEEKAAAAKAAKEAKAAAAAERKAELEAKVRRKG